MAKTPTIKIILSKKFADSETGYLTMRVLLPGKRRYLFKSLGYNIDTAYWDADNEKVIKLKEARQINDDISRQKRELELEFEKGKLNNEIFNHASVSGKMRKTNEGDDFIAFYRQYIDYMRKERKGRNGKVKKHSDNYIKKHEGYLSRVIEYAKGRLSFSDINARWMENLELWASKDMNYETSLPVFMSKFKSVLKRAADFGVFSMQQIAGYKIPQYVNPDREYLTISEVEAIADLIYSGKLDNHPKALKVACFFIVECTAGLRFSDWSRFKIEKIDKHEALRVRAKKNGVHIYAYLHKSPMLKKMVDYIRKNNIVFDLAANGYSAMVETNRLLKDTIAMMAGIDKHLTTHVGRHTCATLLLEKRYSFEGIAEWLGISIPVVMIYAKHTSKGMKDEYERLGGL